MSNAYYMALQNYLTNGRYTLEDAQGRIALMMGKGYIDLDQFEQLDAIAATRAVYEPSIAETLAALTARVEAAEKTAAELVAAAAKVGITLAVDTSAEPEAPISDALPSEEEITT